MPRLTLETYHPDPSLLEGLGAERPDLSLPAVIDNWRDYHRERGTAIKDFNASLRRWVRQEKPPPRASPNGHRPLSREEYNDQGFREVFGESDDVPEVIEAAFRRHQ